MRVIDFYFVVRKFMRKNHSCLLEHFIRYPNELMIILENKTNNALKTEYEIWGIVTTLQNMDIVKGN